MSEAPGKDGPEVATVEDMAWINELKKELEERRKQQDADAEASVGHWLVDSTRFQVVVGVFLLANTLQMGLEIQFPDFREAWTICENVFTFIFLVEMIVKLIFLKHSYFCDPANVLDFFIVTTSVIDCWILSLVMGNSANMQSFSILRVLRLVRLVRVIRLVKHVRQLVVVIKGVVGAISTTVWVALVVIAALYVGAIFCTEYIGRGTESLYPGYAEDLESIEEQEVLANFNPYMAFGDMPKSMFTLFNVAIMAEWVEVVRPVSVKQPALALFFICFCFFVTFGVMNVVVGMIVDNVGKENERIENEHEQKERDRKLGVLSSLQQIIFQLDLDGDGLVTEQELAQVMKAEREAVKAERHVLGHAVEEVDEHEHRAENLAMCLERLGPPDGITANELLCLLDNDGDGTLRFDEFIKSFYRLIECTDFQRMCLMQIGINHVKSLVNRESTEIQKIVSLVNFSQQKTLSRIDDLERQLKAMQTGTPQNGAICESDILTALIADQNGGINDRDGLAALIKEVQKSIDRNMYDLKSDMQAIGKEIHDQKHAARCQSSQWENGVRMVGHDHINDCAAFPRSAVRQGSSSEDDPPSATLGAEDKKPGFAFPVEEEMVARHSAGALAEREATCVSRQVAGTAVNEDAQQSTPQPLVRGYLDAVVRNVGHKVQQNICGIAGCFPVDSYTPLGDARGEDSQMRPRIAGIAADGDLSFYFEQEGQLGITIGKWGESQACLERYPQITKVDQGSEGSRRGLMVDDAIVTCNDRSPLGMSRQGFLDMMQTRPLQLTLERSKVLRKEVQSELTPQEDRAVAQVHSSSRSLEKDRGEGC